MEPARRIELRLPPYRGGVLPLPLNRRVAGRPGFEPGSSRSKGRAGLPIPPPPIKSPHPVLPRASRSYKERLDVGPRGACPRRDSNAHCRSPRDRDSYRLVYEDKRAATRGRTGSPAVRKRGRKPCAAAWLPGLESNQRAPVSETGRDASNPPGNGAEGAIRTHRPRGLSSRGLAGCRHSRKGAPGGI
jgi:hypothetical protein